MTVGLSSEGNLIVSTTTDAQGRFVLSVPPGTYTVTGCDGALAPANDTVTVRANEATTHDVHCSFP
jgi:hypothetical protein